MLSQIGVPAAPSETDISTKANRGFAWSGASQAIVAVADMLSQMIVVARWLSIDELGIAAMALPFYSVIDAVADFGVTNALIQSEDHTPDRLSTLFWFNAMLSGALFAILVVLGPLYGRLEGYPVVGWLLIAYGGKLFAQNFSAIPYALLRKELKFADVAKIRTFAYLTESVTRIAFAAGGWSIWCYTLASIAKAVVLAVIIQIVHPFWPRLVFRWKEIEGDVRFGLRAAASQLLYYTYTALDMPIVAYFFGAAANGLYALADWIVLEAVKTIANVMIDVAYPTFARLRTDAAALVNEYIKITRLNLMTILPLIVFVLLVAPEFLHVVYDGGTWTYDNLEIGATACRILCIMGVLRAIGLIGPPLLDGIGRPGLTLRYMIACTIIVPLAFVLCAWLLGPHLSSHSWWSEVLGRSHANMIAMLSVPIAWAIGYPIALLLLQYLVAQSIDLPIGRFIKALLPIFACALAGVAVGFAASLLVADADRVVRMIVVGGSGLGGMAALLAFWQGITPRSIVASLK